MRRRGLRPNMSDKHSRERKTETMRKNVNQRRFFCSGGGVHSFTHSLCHCLTLQTASVTLFYFLQTESLVYKNVQKESPNGRNLQRKRTFSKIKSHNLIILQTCGHARLVHVLLASLKSPKKLDKPNLNTHPIKKDGQEQEEVEAYSSHHSLWF